MPTTKFFANIVSRRDNGAEIELNLRGTHYYDPGRYCSAPEDCYPAESETIITDCKVIVFRKGLSDTQIKAWATTVDFYEFSETEQERFLEAAAGQMEFE